jgi:2,3-bisphosphoglycerate-dependent phosphoglycerate mutase
LDDPIGANLDQQGVKMQLYFIRHGESENNARWTRTGSSEGRSEDAELTDIGHQQAEIVAQYLAEKEEFGITHLYCSLMVRAVATGMAIAEALDVPLVAWTDLHEEGGIYLKDKVSGERIGQPGKTRTYFERAYPGLVLPDSLGEEGWWNRPFEEYEIRPARARQVLHELLARHGGMEDRVALVSHGGFYNQFLGALLGFTPREKIWFAMYNAAITRIDFRRAEEEEPADAERPAGPRDLVRIVYTNRVDFLPEELVT